MPEYPFRCSNCGIELELTRSIHEEVPSTICDCGAIMSRIYGAVPAIFTGSGFYKTDRNKK